MVIQAAQLIGADWGSTGLRVFLIGAQGQVLDSRASADGSSVMNGDPAAYAAALERQAGDWLRTAPELPLLICGMAGSKHGWQEVPYAATPAEVGALLAQARPVHLDGCGRRAFIVPGLLYRAAGVPPDVMRGEETQIAGVLALQPQLDEQSCIILPGTHAKWSQISHGRVTAFATHMTGELFALLSQHSVLARLMPAQPGAHDAAAFDAGVLAARDGKAGDALGHQLFAVRTLGLMEQLPSASLPDYLSGLLVGHELRAGLAWRAAAGMERAPLALVGESALCQRYSRALSCFDAPAPLIFPNTAPVGLWSQARHAGLLDITTEASS